MTHNCHDLLTLLQHDIETCFEKVEKIGDITLTHIHDENKKKEWLPNTFDLSKFPAFIRPFIIPNIKYGCRFDFNIFEKNDDYDYDDVHDDDGKRYCSTIFCAPRKAILKEELSNIVYQKLVAWVRLAYKQKTSSSDCASSSLVFYVYLLELPKEISNHDDNDDNMIIGEKNANSGFTFACQEAAEVVVYRREEWFKVLIHETFHALGLDFATSSFTSSSKRENAIILQTFVGLNSDINLFEAYTETWAEIIALMFHCISKKKNKMNSKLFHLLFQEHVLFKMFQMVKVLYHMEKLTLDGLFDRSAKGVGVYKEDTNIFSYYVVTCMLLFSVEKFFAFCSKKDTSKGDVAGILQFRDSDINKVNFAQLICQITDVATFRSEIHAMEKLYIHRFLANVKTETNLFFQRTMRMTIYDVDILG